MYRNDFDFCLSTLCSAPLLKSLLSYSHMFVGSLGFPTSSENKDSFIFSFPICIPFISFVDLIGLPKISNTILNRSGKVDLLVLFLTSGKKHSVFYHYM